MPLKTRLVAQALTAKGFKDDASRDHVYYFFFHNGKKTAIRTKISHSEKEISDSLCGFMARQVKLTVQQFKSFVDCRLTEEMYVKLLIESRQLSPPEHRADPPAPSAQQKPR